ncbi:MAG: o-succinylbenzoate synthase [Bacteroidetes bacterium]|nr:o-succinylbenzoate synthase [Bacteroidota bacterium]
MQFTSSVYKHTLNFHFSAGTSRGVLHQKDSWFIQVSAAGRHGIGEAGPLPGLSPEGADLEAYWPGVLKSLQKFPLPEAIEDVYDTAAEAAAGIASIQFALETALLDWLMGGRRLLFDSHFSRGTTCIPINGLIWMAERETMRKRIDEKMAQGFSCLKLKIGAIDFEEELSLLQYIRSQYSADSLTIRVDANGAFSPADAPNKLARLAAWDLHSIEQPIKPGQAESMRALCKISPVPIALDEELIGVVERDKMEQLLDSIMPPSIILKPSLLGGIAATESWIKLARERGIGWWLTSALESNIGLNAIAQYTATHQPVLPQGLGTGQLYTNNMPSPLQVDKGVLCYQPQQAWDLSLLRF